MLEGSPSTVGWWSKALRGAKYFRHRFEIS
jgi:hypothetical protein